MTRPTFWFQSRHIFTWINQTIIRLQKISKPSESVRQHLGSRRRAARPRNLRNCEPGCWLRFLFMPLPNYHPLVIRSSSDFTFWLHLIIAGSIQVSFYLYLLVCMRNVSFSSCLCWRSSIVSIVNKRATIKKNMLYNLIIVSQWLCWHYCRVLQPAISIINEFGFGAKSYERSLFLFT